MRLGFLAAALVFACLVSWHQRKVGVLTKPAKPPVSLQNKSS